MKAGRLIEGRESGKGEGGRSLALLLLATKTNQSRLLEGLTSNRENQRRKEEDSQERHCRPDAKREDEDEGRRR